MPTEPAPRLSAIVVHWRNEVQLERLIAAWPDDPRSELIVVDNSRSAGDPARYGVRHGVPGVRNGVPVGSSLRLVRPPSNLGFGGGVDFGARNARGDLLLVLNPDLRPAPDAIDHLLRAFDAYPDAAGIVPRLVDENGRSQHRWQLRPLPTPLQLVAQTLRLVAVHGPTEAPPAGTPIGQPAAAALGLRRAALDAVGGMDSGFFPAWFEDVDLARRFAERGDVLRYAPASCFTHAGGASIPALGYGAFLWIYYRHLVRYLRRHHGPGWSGSARAMLVLGMSLRLLALPIRRPRQARSQAEAMRALAAVAAGAVTGWRYPRGCHRAFTLEDAFRDHG